MIDNDSSSRDGSPSYARPGDSESGRHRYAYGPGAHDSASHFNRDHAEREARDALGRARSELQELLEGQKNTAAGQVEAVAQALRSTADELHNKNQTTVASYVGHVADRIEHWSGRLRTRHIESLGDDIRYFANRQPALFVAGAAIIGFAAARFLTSSNFGGSTAARPARATDDYQSATSAPAYGISHNE